MLLFIVFLISAKDLAPRVHPTVSSALVQGRIITGEIIDHEKWEGASERTKSERVVLQPDGSSVILRLIEFQ